MKYLLEFGPIFVLIWYQMIRSDTQSTFPSLSNFLFFFFLVQYEIFFYLILPSFNLGLRKKSLSWHILEVHIIQNIF